MTDQGHSKFHKLETELKSLFAAASAGDGAAYHEFLVTLAPYLRGFFKKRMQFCPDRVEDLVQEVLLAIHLKKHTYDPALPISAWIHAIAKYKYVDFVRASRHDFASQSVEDDSDLLAYSDTIAQESLLDVEKLLDSLPAPFRIPIQLTKLAGYSVNEASEISGLSESAVKIGVHRGLKKLSKMLGIKYEY